MSGRWWRWSRLATGAAILVVLVTQVGVAPFLRALPMISGWPVAAAVGITALTTACCAWRWSLVSKGLGVDVPLGRAVAAYYSSQFLNVTLPGGVLGDVHRGLRHGREAGDLGRGLRAVAWERCAGQVAQVLLAMVVLLTVPSPVQPLMPLLMTATVMGSLVLLLLGRGWLRRGPSWWTATLRAAVNDVRDGVLARRAWPGIVVASAVAVIGHTAVFMIAARLAGSDQSSLRLLPLAFLVLLAMAVPTNIAGWGPREGVAAWAFHAAGMSAAQGVTTAVVYGVLVLVASLPGAAVLVATWLRPVIVADSQVPHDGRPLSTPRRGGLAGG